MLHNALFLSYNSTGTVFLDALEQKTDFGTKGKIKIKFENGAVTVRANGWLLFTEMIRTDCRVLQLVKRNDRASCFNSSQQFFNESNLGQNSLVHLLRHSVASRVTRKLRNVVILICLCFLILQVTINARIVVVGASDVGISFLETFVFW